MSLSADLVVVSDVHLLHTEDQRGSRLIEVIGQCASGTVANFVMLGDIFDICLGNHRYFQRKFAKLGEALTQLANAGTNVFYIEGNHEFRIDGLAWSKVNFITEGSLSLEISEKRYLFEHGDLIYSHDRYKKFRKFIKSRAVTETLRFFPGKLLDRLATGSAKVSRAQDEYREINHDKILSHAWGWLESGGADRGIFGHFHVPYAEIDPTNPKRGLYSVSSWDEPSVLVLKDDEFFRWYVARHGDPQLTETKPVCR